MIRFRVNGRQSKKSASAPLLKLCLLQIVLQLLAPARVAELAQRLGLDLTDAFARHVELLSDLFEGALAAVLQAEPQGEHLLFVKEAASAGGGASSS